MNEAIGSLSAWLSWTCFMLAAGGSIYALAAGTLVRRFFRRRAPALRSCPSVTILKPLHGIEPGLYENLASFCAQDYPGPVQIIFGVQDPVDPAIAAVRRLIDASPAEDLELVINPHPHGVNRKVANLINMAPAIRHEVVVLADSDMRVEPDYLTRVLAVLEQPGVGLVTCLYRGAPASGLWALLASMAIDYHFLPSILVGLGLGIARPCFGSTIALRRETLAAIGGFEAFADQLADDNAVGEAVRRAGWAVAIPSLAVAHSCTERSARELLRHELRWARTIRAVDPAGFAGSVVTHPLPFALLGAAASGFGAAGLVAVAGALACRWSLQTQVDHALGVSPNRWWLVPVRDIMSFLVFIASFFVSAVSWRGYRYRVRPDGTLAPG